MKVGSIEDGRAWTTICGDAVPYLLGTKFQDKYYICNICKYVKCVTTYVKYVTCKNGAHT